MYMNHKTSFHGLIALLIIISVVVGLSACGTTGKQDAEESTETERRKIARIIQRYQYSRWQYFRK